ncbi:amino acid adenylation domain-containing protein [Paenibacillus sp. SI8]|uniref:amino acid adenylation domain-containing protein n=1 Tax=Paenibacillus sp. SI8 TaxID=3163026 RepID=UPI003467B9DD
MSDTLLSLSETKRNLLQRLLQTEGVEASDFEKIPKRDHPGGAPLSFGQERLWFMSQLNPESPVYNMPASVRLEGTLDIKVLENSLYAIIRRHDVLRTTFQMINGEMLQAVHDELMPELTVIDLQHMAEHAQEEEVSRQAADGAQHRFELNLGPLVWMRLLQLDSKKHVLLFNVHHMVFDGWSMGIFFQELAVLYEAFIHGKPSLLPELSIQYGDFAQWQKERLQGERMNQLLSYWKEQLSGVSTVLDLPTDRPRKPIQSFNGAACYFIWPNSLLEQIEAFSQREGVTLFMTLISVLKTLLYRYTEQENIVVGTPVAGRSRLEMEPLIGLMLNTLALHVEVSGDLSYRELLARVREATLGAFAHQELPFEKLVEELQPERDFSRHPLFQVMLVLQNAPFKLELSGVDMRLEELNSGTAKFDLNVQFTVTNEGLCSSWEYNTDLFNEETVLRIADHFWHLLEEAIAGPERKLSEFTLLTVEERHQMLTEWNDTAAEYASEQHIHRLFEEQAAKQPDATAVLWVTGSWSYRELNEQANRLARYLRRHGVIPGTRVAICMERSWEMVVGLLGIMKAGGVYVPLDPTHPEERLAYITENAEAAVLLTQTALTERLSGYGGQRICMDQVQAAIRAELADNLEEAGELAYIIYTSGSTGTPKGVMVRHQPVINLIEWVNRTFEMGASDRVLWITSYGFDLSVYDLFGLLAAGGSIRIANDDEVRDPERLLHYVCHDGITFWDSAPAALQQVVPFLGGQAEMAKRSQLRLVFLSGDWIPVKLPDALRTHFPQAEVVGLGGGTEATVWSNFYRIGEVDPEQKSIPYGKPIQNARYYIADRNLNLCPVGVAGELYIGGECLAEGYAGAPELTAERFVVDLFGAREGAKMYRTGDRARFMADGNIEFLGRVDNQVKVRGFRVELGEIEAVLHQHPDVEEALVAVHNKPVSGDKELAVYIVPAADRSIPMGELRTFLKERLPEYMIPAAFVELKAMPVTANGKIDRRALPEPDKSRMGADHEYVTPRTPNEEALAKVWSEVLNLEKVGVQDNFFELGGDSILAIRVMAKVKEKGLNFTPKDLFQHRTIAELARVVKKDACVEAEQGIVTGAVPLTPIQRWFFEQELEEAHHFNLSIVVEAKEAVNLELLEQALQCVVLHHDALRLRFTPSGEGWKQENRGSVEPISIAHIDLSSYPESEQSAAFHTLACELQGSLHVTDGPLLRVAHFCMGADRRSQLLIAIHHLVADGVSLQIIMEDLQTAYEQLRQGEEVRLPAKTTSFKQWAEQLADYAQSGALNKELSFWKNQDLAHNGHLPVDDPGGLNRAGTMQTVSATLPVKETTALLQDVPRAYHTQLREVLLAALARAFEQWLGKRSLLVDLEGHGREPIFEQIDVSRTVGWFTSLYRLRLDLGNAEKPGDVLKTMKEQVRKVPYGGLGFGLLRYLGDQEARESLRALEQADVVFNYLGQFDNVLAEVKSFELVAENSDSDRSSRGLRPYLLEINARIMEGQLRIDWNYSESIHRRSTIERVANDFMDALKWLMEHCLSSHAGGYTPSDFEGVNLNQEELDRLLFRATRTREGGQ